MAARRTNSSPRCTTTTTPYARRARQRLYEVTADRELDAGRHDLEFRFEWDEVLGGTAMLRQDGEVVGTGKIERFTPVAFNEVMIGLTCGYEWGPSVGGDYDAPFAFNGTIVRAEVSPTGPVVRDPVAEVAAILAAQRAEVCTPSLRPM